MKKNKSFFFHLMSRTALITGSSRNGLEIARVLANRGYQLILACRDLEKGHAVAKSMEASGRKCTVASFDLCDGDKIKEGAETIAREAPAGIDVLIHSAGISCPSVPCNFFTTQKIVDTNYHGTVAAHLAFRPFLKDKARIIFLSHHKALASTITFDFLHSTLTSRDLNIVSLDAAVDKYIHEVRGDPHLATMAGWPEDPVLVSRILVTAFARLASNPDALLSGQTDYSFASYSSEKAHRQQVLRFVVHTKAAYRPLSGSLMIVV